MVYTNIVFEWDDAKARTNALKHGRGTSDRRGLHYQAGTVDPIDQRAAGGS